MKKIFFFSQDNRLGNHVESTNLFELGTVIYIKKFHQESINDTFILNRKGK